MIPASGPTRKQRFFAALALAGMTQEQWRTTVYQVSGQHLNEVFKGERDASADLNAAIDSFIADTLDAYLRTISRDAA
jgi:hypothetical protein